MSETKETLPYEPFNPSRHLIQIKSGRDKPAQDYLPVQWRLVWFRSLCPGGTIETEIVHLDLDRETEEETYAWNSETRRSEKIVKRAPGIAVFRATVRDGKGGMAIGTKSEKAASFGDFIEKAETGAIGRALAALGYGTQFTGDEFDEQHRIVDAPVEKASPSRTPTESEDKKPSVPVQADPGQQVPTSAVPSIGRIRNLANRLYASEGGYPNFKAFFVGKHDLGDIADEDIPERIRSEMADLIREDASSRKKQPAA
jgi:hypothetical protein